MKRYADTFEEIEEIFKKIGDLDCDRADDESMADYKKRVESLYLPLISKLEGVMLEWKVPNYADIASVVEGFVPPDEPEEVIHINTDKSPIKDIINSALSVLSVRNT